MASMAASSALSKTFVAFLARGSDSAGWLVLVYVLLNGVSRDISQVFISMAKFPDYTDDNQAEI